MKLLRFLLIVLFPVIVLFSVVVLFPATVAAQEKSFSITGRLSHTDSRYVTLIYWRAGKQIKNTAAVADDRYTFNGTITNEGTAMLKEGTADDPADTDHLLLFYLDGESFRITHTNKFSDAAFEGSPAETEYLRLRGAEQAWFRESERLKTEQQLAKARQEDDLAKRSGDSILVFESSKAEKLYGSYMRNNPGSPLLLFAFNKYYAAVRGNSDADQLTALFGMLPDSIRELPSSKAFLEQITNGKTYNTVVTIGKPAPDFTMNDTLGKPIVLSSLRGHYLLLDFWASWCGPCRAENPNVVREYAKYHDKGFSILSVSLDQPGKKESWLKAIHDDGLTWLHVSDLKFWNSAVVKLYGIQGIPLNFLIDPKGNIIARNLRGDDLEKELSRIYRE